MDLLLLLWVVAAVPNPPEIRFDRLVKQVRDGEIDRQAAQVAFQSLLRETAATCRARCGEGDAGGRWVFPLAGYGPAAIGGTRGEGYQPGRFDFFDGNRHRGHPAHDLFIHDRDQDALDDATRLPVGVVSVSAGIVASLERTWAPESAIRGGRYVCVLDPTAQRLYYYAHLKEVAVELGACVAPGSMLGTLGRTGTNAGQRRSPTHLHFMALDVRGGAPKPWDPYEALRAARQQTAPTHPPTQSYPYAWPHDASRDEPISIRFPPPPGFVREPAAAESFSAWLAGLPLKPGRPPVLLHDGSRKANQSAHEAVLDMDTGWGDLQQCADAVIRLRAEYLYSRGRLGEICFNSTSGEKIEYARWRGGERPSIRGGRVVWTASETPDPSYAGFRRYLRFVFQFAGTASLAAELAPVADIRELRSADVFIRGGYPGHAVLVADVAIHPATGRKAFLLMQSYMPAQEVHILRNPANPAWSPWYEVHAGDSLVTPEWTFKFNELRRFAP